MFFLQWMDFVHYESMFSNKLHVRQTSANVWQRKNRCPQTVVRTHGNYMATYAKGQHISLLLMVQNSCTTCFFKTKTPANNRINYRPQLVITGFLPTVSFLIQYLVDEVQMLKAYVFFCLPIGNGPKWGNKQLHSGKSNIAMAKNHRFDGIYQEK